jgi:hypothetical protein
MAAFREEAGGEPVDPGIRTCYGSAEFKEGRPRFFLLKPPPQSRLNLASSNPVEAFFISDHLGEINLFDSGAALRRDVL